MAQMAQMAQFKPKETFGYLRKMNRRMGLGVTVWV